MVAYVRVVDGELRKGDQMVAMQTGTEADDRRDRLLRPADDAGRRRCARARSGYLITGIKDVSLLRVGDTLTTKAGPAAEPLPGYREVKPMVFCGLFPVDTDQFPELRDALEKLALNDAALSWEPETSQALGFGFRCGFLGLLHMDIVRERLEREYDLELLATTPTVEYEVTLTDGTEVSCTRRPTCPTRASIEEIREPYIRATILMPREHVGAVMELCQERRGMHVDMSYLVRGARADPLRPAAGRDRARLLRPAEVAHQGLRVARLRAARACAPADLVKLDILLAGDNVDALSMIVHKDKAYAAGRMLTERLRKQIPRQQFEVAIQAAIGSKIIARESVKPMRKDVIAKCYGGDITRKRKLLEKQKAGKKRMKQVGPHRGAAGGVPGGPRAVRRRQLTRRTPA